MLSQRLLTLWVLGTDAGPRCRTVPWCRAAAAQKR